MDDKISLKGMFGVMTISALILVIMRLAILNRGEHAIGAISIALLIPIITFGLFGATYLLMLPFGVMASQMSESAQPAISPFAQDRLPDQLISVDDKPINRGS